MGTTIYLQPQQQYVNHRTIAELDLKYLFSCNFAREVGNKTETWAKEKHVFRLQRQAPSWWSILKPAEILGYNYNSLALMNKWIFNRLHRCLWGTASKYLWLLEPACNYSSLFGNEFKMTHTLLGKIWPKKANELFFSSTGFGRVGVDKVVN